MLDLLLAGQLYNYNLCQSYYEPPRHYYIVENNTPYTLEFQLHGYWRTLEPYAYEKWYSQIGNTAIDRCGYYYGDPVFPAIELDQFPLNTTWDKIEFDLEVDLYNVMSIEETYRGSGELKVMMYYE